MSTDYVLGNDQEELARLKLQYDLWKDELVRLWDIAGLKNYKKLMDLGCGPGFTTYDLIQYLSVDAKLVSVDISDNFLSFLSEKLKKDHISNRVITHKSFIESLNLQDKDYQAAFCRWLLIFVQNPQKAIETVGQHLVPGSPFVIQEYVSYDSMDLVPDYKHMRPVVEAIFKSWRDQGGDPNRGKNIPFWLEKNGFKVTHIEPRAKFARPNESLWMWPETFYKSFLPRLEKSGYLSSKQVSDFFEEWESAKKAPGSYFICPTVVNIVGIKK